MLSAPPGAAPTGWQGVGAGAPRPYGAIVTRRGIVAIKPLGLGDILDGAFKAIRHNPRVMIGLSLLVVLITTLLSLAPVAASFVSSYEALIATPDPDATANEAFEQFAGPFATLLGGSLIGSLIAGFGGLILNGILILSVGQSVVDRKITTGETWRGVRGRLLPLVGQSLLIGICLIGPSVVILAIGGALAAFVDPIAGIAVTVVGLLATAVAAVYLSTVWALGPAVLVLERVSVIASLRRSRALLRGVFWRTLGILILTSLIVGLITQILAIPSSLVSQVVIGFAAASPDSTLLLVVGIVIAYVGAALVTVLVYPYLAGVISLLYIDRRIRVEGLDISLNRAMAENAA